jgi:hypothetical protein
MPIAEIENLPFLDDCRKMDLLLKRNESQFNQKIPQKISSGSFDSGDERLRLIDAQSFFSRIDQLLKFF